MENEAPMVVVTYATTPLQEKTAYERTKEWRAKNSRAEEARRYRAKHPDKVKAIKEAYRERSKQERLPKEAAKARERRAADPVAQKIRSEQYQQRQRDKQVEIAGSNRATNCELCGEQCKTVFDHCHSTGIFRGWLCNRCNRTLGQVKDNAELLGKMINYLENFNDKVDGKGPQSTS